MQRSGVRQDDPEYIKVHNILAAVQKQQAYQKQRQMHQQQLQQQQLQQQQLQQQQPNGNNVDVVANGVNGMSFNVLAKS